MVVDLQIRYDTGLTHPESGHVTLHKFTIFGWSESAAVRRSYNLTSSRKLALMRVLLLHTCIDIVVLPAGIYSKISL